MLRILCIQVLLLVSLIGRSQAFEGKIVTDIKVIEAPAELQGHEAMMNSNMTMFISRQHVRMDIKSLAANVIVLVDSVKKEAVSCMDMMGQKIAMIIPFEEGADAVPGGNMYQSGSFTLTNETKTIAGMECKKAIWNSGDPNMPEQAEIWYAPGVALDVSQYNGLPGYPMECTIKQEGMVMKYTVTEVIRQKNDPSLFVVPDGYTFKTMEEMMGVPGGK